MGETRQSALGLIAAAALVLVPCRALAQDSIAKRLGLPEDARPLIVHADDAGITHSTNAAIEQAFASGAISSSSIIVPSPWFPEIAAFAKAHPEYDFGVHLVLTSEWEYLRWGGAAPADKIPSLLDKQGFLWPSAQDVAAHAKPDEARAELHAQVDRALRFGVPVTHLDTHMQALMSTPELAQVYVDLGREYHLPILLWPASARTDAWLGPLIAANPAKFVKPQEAGSRFPGPLPPLENFPERYRRFVTGGAPDQVTEIIVHMAVDGEESRAAMGDGSYGASWRANDLRIFSGQEMRAFLKDQHVQLVTWRRLALLATAH